MQFIRRGPDVPERLLQAHEDGRVVFFCGAGISYPAHLPGFAGLTSRLFSDLGEAPNAIQRAAIKAGQFDTAIGLLEEGIAGGRETVRRALANILKPDLTATGAMATHEALLTLAKTRSGQTRLITTNFDRLFEEVIDSKHLAVERFRAPLLRAPKNRWDGLVYLHGLITPAASVSDLNSLVVSSGDFGLAYLTERWAARFVSELFRNYTVCFVGYSINDPVLRYMMDALAADRLLGESPPEMFAFGSFSKGKEEERRNEWKAKNVTPILYREHGHHAYLHRTLTAWAATYRDGVNGNERIVMQWAVTRPVASTKEDDFVGRMIWALTDPQALPAKRFANFDPAPSIDWLEPLCADRFHYEDLPRFRVPRDSSRDGKLSFSLTRRPAHYSYAARMELVNGSSRDTDWDDVMGHLAHWLTRHLDDPQLLVWVAKRGGRLHQEFARLISQRLEFLAERERAGDIAELERIRAGAPNAIPRPAMRTLWRLVLAGRAQRGRTRFDLYMWASQLRRDGLTVASRFELRQMLTPRISIREPFHFPDVSGERGKDLVDCDVVLSVDDVHSALGELRKAEQWRESLSELLADASILLLDAMDLMRAYGGADDRSDFSYIHQPSIGDHPQNRGFQDWTALVEIARDAWLATAAKAPGQALAYAEQWWQLPYPIFKRLSLFAATHEGVVPSAVGLTWLLADDGWWLWSVETEHETLRLIVELCTKATAQEIARLETAVLAGPPPEMFREDIEPERLARVNDREVWLRLAKMRAVGALQEGPGAKRLTELVLAHPEWQVATDGRDEFPHWMGDVSEFQVFAPAPRSRRELVEWLKQRPAADDWQGDDWRQRCRDDFPTTATALCALAREGNWPADRWRDALQAWSEETLVKRSWRYMAPLLARATDEFLTEVAHAVSWWLQALAKTFIGREEVFLALCRRMLGLNLPVKDSDDDPVGTAINHPVGHVVDALLKFWYRGTLQDGQGLPQTLRAVFTDVSDTQNARLKHGRVLLAAHTLSLFRVDPRWTSEYLLPLFEWQRSAVEARGAWEGFLWSPRLYRPLMDALKRPFLETAHHYESLGDHDRQYASLLTYAALDPGDTFSLAQLTGATRALPAEGLAAAADALMRAQEGAGEQRSDYWKNRVRPYLQSIWPKARERVTSAIAESFARLAIETREAFPDAMSVLRSWLVPIEHSDYTVHLLHESGLSSKFPAEALELLTSIVDVQVPWMPRSLHSCLEAIAASSPHLREDPRFVRLLAYVRRNQ